MVFASIEFLWFFLPLVLAAYVCAPPRWRNALLAVASLGFYAWGAKSVVLLFLASIAFNFAAGHLIGARLARGDAKGARLVKVAAVTIDLLVLAFWKYAVFLVTQLDSVLGGVGAGEVAVPDIALPIGISFFTFHGISYVVDVARGTSPPLRRPWDYVQYMAFFPQLIAGPIVRYHQIDEQIRTPPARSERADDIEQGFLRFALGLGKKVLIADQVGRIADAAFATSDPTTATAWIGVLAYTIQIYFDFSGYSDMAIGLARMFGFRFPENFDRPYSAISVTDYWRRWHMTLSRFFRDYVFIPLGGSRGTPRQAARNLFLVFVLTGIWHGAGWTFALWGAYHGALVVLEKLTGWREAAPGWEWPRRGLTFLLVVLGFVTFRASDLGQAADFYGAMFSPSGLGTAAIDAALNRQTVLALAVGLLSVLMPRDVTLGRLVERPAGGWPSLGIRVAVLVALPWAAVAIAAGSFSPFLYFQF